MTSTALNLLFSDSRLPAGGHAHSGGIEEAVAAGIVHDELTLADFLEGRLLAAGLLAAAAAVAVCARGRRWIDEGDARCPAVLHELWAEVDAELDARTPSPAQRLASRSQGSLLLRAAAVVVPGPVVSSLVDWSQDRGTHHAVALGATGASAGITTVDLATSAAYQSVAGPASAAVRLLGLSPLRVTKLVADLAPALDRAAALAQPYAAALPLRELPAHAAPHYDLLAEAHLERTERLFAS
jgi:urease accessory protein